MCKKCSLLLKRCLLFLLNLVSLFFLGSCKSLIEDLISKNTEEEIEAPVMYGMPLNYKYFDVTGYVVGDIDGDGATEPLPDIDIFLTTQDGESVLATLPVTSTGYGTDEAGRVWVSVGDSITDDEIVLTLTDVDPDNNGSFASKSMNISASGSDVDLGTVTLEKNN